MIERRIGRDQKQKFLLTVNKENKVERRLVTIGALRDGLRVIESGIGPDDLVIVDGLQRARAGSVVAPHPAQQAGTAPSTPALVDEAKKTAGGAAN